ncbi:serine/threonine protein kinase [Micromonosporaceae bacterium B7E4]
MLTVSRAGEILAPAAGRITVKSGYWLLSNFNASTAYLVENLTEAGEYIKVDPCRDAAPIPFELSRVVLPGNCGPQSLNVLSPSAARVDPADVISGLSFRCGGLNTRRKYFLVLVALCEPRLIGEWHVGVPSVPEIVERLRPLPGWSRLSRNTINYHIDYLAEQKLRNYLGRGSLGVRVRWKREALVSIALRHDLVRAEHLALLPPVSGDPATTDQGAADHGRPETPCDAVTPDR